jgi:hypothetical protein
MGGGNEQCLAGVASNVVSLQSITEHHYYQRVHSQHIKEENQEHAYVHYAKLCIMNIPAGGVGFESGLVIGEIGIAVPEQLMEEIADVRNLKEAYFRVRSNKGSAGIDKMTVEELGDYLLRHYDEISQQLLQGTFKPQPVRRVEIAKSTGGTRNSAFRVQSIGSSSKPCCKSCRNTGTRHSLNTAMDFDQDARSIRQLSKRRSMYAADCSTSLIWIWRNFSTESIRT